MPPSVSAAHVLGPTWPSAVRLRDLWNARTAVSVSLRNSLSTVQGNPSTVRRLSIVFTKPLVSQSPRRTLSSHDDGVRRQVNTVVGGAVGAGAVVVGSVVVDAPSPAGAVVDDADEVDDVEPPGGVLVPTAECESLLQAASEAMQVLTAMAVASRRSVLLCMLQVHQILGVTEGLAALNRVGEVLNTLPADVTALPSDRLPSKGWCAHRRSW